MKGVLRESRIRYRYWNLELPKASFREQSFGEHKRALRMRKTPLISCHCGDTRMCWYGSVVMCRLWPEARSRARPSQKKPGQAGPNVWPEPAFGPAWDMVKPKPLA